MHLGLKFFLITALAVLGGCASYTSETRQAREEFYSGKYSDAAKTLEKGAHEDSKDQVLYLFDRATALHHAQDFEGSNGDFHIADKLTEIKDYTSLTQEIGSLITTDRIMMYKGEDFEKILISQYLAINYLMLKKYEDALVECRRVNHKLHMMISQGKRPYKLSAMASYLSAMIYEDQGQWSDAYIDYQQTYKLRPDFPYLKYDLVRLALKNGIREDVEKWKERFGLSSDDVRAIREEGTKPEIVLLIENGKSPEKHPHPSWNAIPHYLPRFNPVSYVEADLEGVTFGRSYPIYDVEATAIQNLDDKYAGILAKHIAGVVAKEVVAHQVEKQTNEWVGMIARIGMYAADQADLRSWLTLPKDFQVLRFRIGSEQLVRDMKLSIRAKAVDGSEVALPSSIEKIVHFDEVKRKIPRVFIPVRVL